MGLLLGRLTCRLVVPLACAVGLAAPARVAAQRAALFADDPAAITHLLNRVARPASWRGGAGARGGVRATIEAQLHPESIPRPGDGRARYPTLAMSASELAASGREARTARRTGPADADSSARSALRRPLLELATARVERAVYSRRQLQEVLVDFWMNHFQRLCRKGRRPVPVASAWLDAGALECRVAVARAIARRAALPEPADAILEKLFPAGSSADLNAVFPQAAAGSGARQALALALSSPVDAGRLAEPGPPARPARARSRLSSGGPEQPPAPDPEGTESAIAISDLDDLTGSADVDPLESEVVALYDRQTDAVLGRAGRELGRAGALLCATRLDAAAPAAVYPRGRLAESLRQIARLIKSDVGLEVAFADVGGWDTHVNQGASEGQLARPPLFGQPSPPLDHRGPRTLSWTLVPAPPWRPPRRRPPAPTDPP